ncbi:MAG TPA: SLC13 family permease [Gammaproteobacteria bacterium]|nr:SLC13 family permease [Gammaproteobacteria bacterium]
MASLPDGHGIFVLLLTAVALFLFTRDKLPLEASALVILLILLLSFELFPYYVDGARLSPTSFLSGFGHEALITIAALMIIGKGLEVTGALQPLAAALARAWMARPMAASLATLAISAALSAFLNNTPIVVMLLPMLVGVALRNRLAPSSLLMPVGFATLVGGMATTIGTSTNLLVVSIAADLGITPFGMFDFTLPVLLVGSVGVLYLWLLAPHLLPERKPPLSDRTPRVFNAMLHINDASAACGLSFAECLALTGNEMRVDRIERGEGLIVIKLPSVTIGAGDRLAVRDTPERLKTFEKQLGATLHGETGLPEGGNGVAGTEPQFLAEIVVTRGSLLHRGSLMSTRFTQRSGLVPLALHRAREPGTEEPSGKIETVQLRAGDVVLVQGTQQQLELLKRSGTALVLDGTTDLPTTHRADRALAIMALVVLAAALGVLPISISALIGVGAMLATRCLSWEDISKSLSAQVIMLIVASLALGIALTETGGALFIAQSFVNTVSILPTPFILSALMLVMAILTNVVSNTAAGVIGTPIAIQVARELGVDPEPFILAVIFGANMSYATPFGYQTNLLLLSAGGYKFTDFLRAGIPLTAIMWLGFSIVLPAIYDL